jgi:hypothetical protein
MIWYHVAISVIYLVVCFVVVFKHKKHLSMLEKEVFDSRCQLDRMKTFIERNHDDIRCVEGRVMEQQARLDDLQKMVIALQESGEK